MEREKGTDQREQSGVGEEISITSGEDGPVANKFTPQSNLIGHGRGVGKGLGGRGCLSLGFINCRGWWSREVDIRVMLKEKGLDVLGLAETFLQRDQEGEVVGYVWYGMNRVGGRRQVEGLGC